MGVWIEFSHAWDDRVHPSRVHAYSAGSRVFVPRDVAERATAAGRATIIDKPDDLKSTKAPGGVKQVNPAPEAASSTKEK